MILVADSGSTKTTWMEAGTGSMIVTEGLNPHFATDEQFLKACHAVVQRLRTQEGELELHFYGAGCGDEGQRRRVEGLLSASLRPDKLMVATDMLGACRATSCGRPSLVGILGTGSNICLFDGQRVVLQPFSTGFILGDNGSANHVGRILLNDYLTRRMPDSLRRLFHDDYPMSDAQLVEAVYHRPAPNRFLASLAPFAVRHMEDDYCSTAIRTALYDWCHGPMATLREAASLDGAELNLVGGFAQAIEPLLRQFFADGPVRVGTVVADPIEGLRQFHLR